MKKVNRLLAYATACAVLLSACKDDVEELEAGKTEMPTKFSSFTTEQNKVNLEDNGIELMDDMSDLKASKSVETSAIFVDFLDRAPVAPANGRVVSTARALKGLQEGKGSTYEVFATMRATQEEPQSIQEAFDTYIGVYSWNNHTGGWDYTKEGDRIVFKFPAIEGGTENNAEFIIHSYTGVQTAKPIDENYTGDLPTQLITEIQVDGNKEMEYKFTAKYNEAGEPTYVSSTLTVSPFVFSVSAENNTENIGAEYSLKRGDKILILLGAGAKGKFTAEHIEAVENSEDANVGDVAEEVNAYFQLMNVKIAGSLNVKKFADGQEEIHASQADSFDYNMVVEKEAALLNESYHLVVFYADKTEKIADTEVYTYTKTYTYYDYWSGEEKVEEYTEMDIRMIFADGSKSDLETYFSNGFEDLTAEISKFVHELKDGR